MHCLKLSEYALILNEQLSMRWHTMRLAGKKSRMPH